MIALTWTLGSGAQEEKDYTYLLGSDSSVHIADLFALADACEKDASRSLWRYYDGLPNTEELNQRGFRAFSDWLGTFALKANTHGEQSFVMRAVFALVTGDELERKVKALADQINMLEQFLKMRFEHIPDVAPQIVTKSRVADFLKAMLSLRDQNKLVAKLLSQLLGSAWDSRILCGIVPRLKDNEGHFTRFIDRGDLTVTLSLQHADSREPEFKRLSQLTFPIEGNATPVELLARLQVHEAKGACIAGLALKSGC